jgi:uncharacterized protein (TIGR02145 family)
MKKLYQLIVGLFIISNNLFAQVGINTDNNEPDPSAMLDVNSSSKGMLIPRMTQAQIGAITNPANGLQVFCTTDSKIYIYIATEMLWKEVAYGTGTILPPFSCGSSITINHVASTVAPVNKTVIYGTITNIPGEPSKCWITSNLGADHQATSANDATEPSAGWYWQFNRKQGYKHDGTSRTPNTTWIYPINEDFDWQIANDPCSIELGTYWRIPTYTEWNNVDEIGGWTNWNGPWSSGLKLHAAGFLGNQDGSLHTCGINGFYRSSAQASTEQGWSISFNSGNSGMGGFLKNPGFSLRCIRDSSSLASLPTVITSAITNITGISATGGGEVAFDGGALVTARGVCWSTSSGPTISNSHTTDGTGTGIFASSITGLNVNTTYYVRAYATNSMGTVYGNEISFATNATTTVTDIDGNEYDIVTIGSQYWMKENLRTTKYNDGTSIPLVTDGTTWNGLWTPAYCWNQNDPSTFSDFGPLYNWFAANTGNLCPTNWHIPSLTEWQILETYLGGNEVAGGKMKVPGTVYWYDPNNEATNSSGFTGLGGGYRHFYGWFNSDKSGGFWWSSSVDGTISAWHIYISQISGNLFITSNNRQAGFSVRCIKD